MSEQDLLQAILQRPKDDLPRLAYADWLQSQTRPVDHARAEFIRLQIMLESMQSDDRRWPDLVRRERELINEFQEIWERPLRHQLKPRVWSLFRWLRANLTREGGQWRFRRGFIEELDSSASDFLKYGGFIIRQAPVRRIVLNHASFLIPYLSRDAALDGLDSLHLVSDVEVDDDMELLAEAARESGLIVFELRYPRIDSDAEVLFSLLRGNPEEDSNLADRLAGMPNWEMATPRERKRMQELTENPRFIQQLSEPESASHAELLELNDWIYLGERLKEANAWAIAKTYQDMEDEQGQARRLVLFKKDTANLQAVDELRESPHFRTELTEPLRTA